MKKTIKIIIAISIVLVALFGVFCIKANASTKGTITEEIVNVRKEASIDSKIVMYVSVNDKVEIIEKTGDWYKIKYNNKEGYVYSDFVKVEEKDADKITNNLKSEDAEITTNTETKIYLLAGSNVKITPNVVSSNILTISKDTTITVLEQVNGWSYINVDRINGWVRNEQIKEPSDVQEKVATAEESKEETKTTESKSINKKAYVKYSSVNLRKEPSTDAAVIEKLKLNTEVTIVEEVDSIWYKVKVGDNTGYISQELLSSEKQKEETTSRDGDTSSREKEETKSVTTNETKKEETKTSTTKTETTTKTATTKTTTTTKTSTTKTKGEEIVAYAKKYLGYAYVYGGSSPKTGFDCSGFTSYVYKHFGYTISRSSVGQASEGTKVEKKDLQPGDLVIYKNNALTKIGHVGIYIGDNKMIHASEPGVGVIITEIDAKSHNYPKRFVMGRRIIK